MIYIPDQDPSNAHTAVAYFDGEAMSSVVTRSQPVFAAIGENSLNLKLRVIEALRGNYLRLTPALTLCEQ